MTDYAPRRPLGDVIVELANAAADAGRRAGNPAGLHMSSIDMSFPIETLLETRDGELVVIADAPRARSRTHFDLPPARLSFTLVAEVTS